MKTLLTIVLILAPFLHAADITKPVSAGSKVTLSATADGTQPIRYEWTRDGVKVHDGQVYIIEQASQSDAGAYYVTAINAFGSADSVDRVVLVIGTAPTPPVITVALANTVVYKQDRLEWSVVADGGGQPLSFRWQKGNSLIPGATAQTLVIPKVNPSHAGVYVVSARNPQGEEASSKATLAVR